MSRPFKWGGGRVVGKFSALCFLGFCLAIAVPSGHSHAATPACGASAGDQQAIGEFLSTLAVSCPCNGFDTHALYANCVTHLVKQEITLGPHCRGNRTQSTVRLGLAFDVRTKGESGHLL